MGRLFSASVLMLGTAVALFAGDNPKVTGSFTFPRLGNASMQVTAQQTDAELLLGKGSIFYQDGNGILNLQVQYVKVGGNTACVASKVAEGSSYPGQAIGYWYVNKFVDNGEPGVGHDTVAGAGLQASTASAALALVEACPNPQTQTGDIVITGGNIQVHQVH